MLRLLVGIGIAVALGCAAGAQGGEPSPSRTLHIHCVGPDAEASAESIRESWFLRRLLRDESGWQVETVVGLEGTDDGADRGEGDVSLVVGRLPLSAEIRRLAAELPLDLGTDESPRLALAGSSYPLDEVAVALRLPSRGRSTPTADWPADWLVTGANESLLRYLVAQVAATVLQPGRFRPAVREDFDYLVLGGELRRLGRWRRRAATGGARYEIDPAHDRDDFTARRRWYRELTSLRRPRVVLRIPAEEASGERWAALADELDRAVARMAPRVPVELDRPLTVVVESASPESHVRLGRYTGDLKPAVLTGFFPNGAPEGSQGIEIHAVLSPDRHPDDRYALFQALGRALIRRAIAERPGSADLPSWLERGAALWLSEEWYGRPYRDWLPRLAAAEVFPTAEELTAPQLGPAVAETLFTPVVAAALDRLPGATLEETFRRAQETDLTRALAGALQAVERAAREGSLPPPTRPASRIADDFLAGVSFAHSPGLESGYHSPRSMDQLDRVRDRLGADAVSLMPFASQRDPAQPAMHFLNQGTGSETDLGMVAGARAAHERGLTVLWKPHVYVGGSWPGEIAMGSEEDWRTWWRTYRRYIVHHAFLAAYAEADLFSVGVELGKTLGREAEWRHLIRSVRLFFRGPLTYSANWWGDADRAPFWDELEYLGVDAYYPLGDSPEMTDLQLVAGARKAVDELRDLAERHGKPVLLTEVGFAARKGAWISPHEEGGEPDERHQARAYDAFLSALGRPSWLAGVFVWKVFSTGSDRPAPLPGFVFLGRPAEKLVRRYFAEREEPRPSTR